MLNLEKMELCFVLVQFGLLYNLRKEDKITIVHFSNVTLFSICIENNPHFTLSKSSPPSASSRTINRKLGVSITSYNRKYYSVQK